MPSVTRMPLAEFIDEHHEQITRDFCAFARTLMPPGLEMTETDLRDHAKDMLMAIRVESLRPI